MGMDMIIIDMPDVNVIFGIYFQGRYEVEIDCKKKKVRFSIDNGEQFTLGEGRILNMTINNITTKKMLNKVCTTYRVHVV